MNKELRRIFLVGCFVTISIVGYGRSSSDFSSRLVGRDIIQAYNFHIQGQPTTTTLNLPKQFTDANWGLKELLCQRAGYDLTPYAGQTVSLVQYRVTENYYFSAKPKPWAAGESLYLWIVAKDGVSVCGFLSAREGSSLIPRVFAVNDPLIK